MYVLDTDTLTHAHAGHLGSKKRVQKVGELNVATTIITAIEIKRSDLCEFVAAARRHECGHSF
jgi:hypothetical protein